MTIEEAIKILKSKLDGSVDTSWEWTEAVRMAIEALKTVQEHKDTFEWCVECKEYDQEQHCCHRWTKQIRKTIAEWESENGIVRCENCIFYEKALSVQGFCHNHGSIVSANAFCSYGSYGERREDGEA